LRKPQGSQRINQHAFRQPDAIVNRQRKRLAASEVLQIVQRIEMDRRFIAIQQVNPKQQTLARPVGKI
jgi:hypothetical protein